MHRAHYMWRHLMALRQRRRRLAVVHAFEGKAAEVLHVQELKAKMARDVNQLSGQIADLDRTITVERQAWAGERQKLELQIEDLVPARSHTQER